MRNENKNKKIKFDAETLIREILRFDCDKTKAQQQTLH